MILLYMQIAKQTDDIFTLEIYREETTLFLFSFCISLTCTIFGITKFLKVGPCRVVPNTGIFGGYGQLGFLLLLFNISSSMLVKMLLLVFLKMEYMFEYNEQYLNNNVPWPTYPFNYTTGFKYVTGYWIVFNIFPQFLYVRNFIVFIKSVYQVALEYAWSMHFFDSRFSKYFRNITICVYISGCHSFEFGFRN